MSAEDEIERLTVENGGSRDKMKASKEVRSGTGQTPGSDTTAESGGPGMYQQGGLPKAAGGAGMFQQQGTNDAFLVGTLFLPNIDGKKPHGCIKRFLVTMEILHLGFFFAPNTSNFSLLPSINRDDLIGLYGEQRGAQNQLALDLLVDATSGAVSAEKIEWSKTVLDAWHAIVSWISPYSEAELELMKRELDIVVNHGDGEDPKILFPESV